MWTAERLRAFAQEAEKQGHGPIPETHFYVGVDLGQKRDPTALGIVERQDLLTGFDYAYWTPRVEKRYDLRTWSGCGWGLRTRRWWTGCGR